MTPFLDMWNPKFFNFTRILKKTFSLKDVEKFVKPKFDEINNNITNINNRIDNMQTGGIGIDDVKNYVDPKLTRLNTEILNTNNALSALTQKVNTNTDDVRTLKNKTNLMEKSINSNSNAINNFSRNMLTRGSFEIQSLRSNKTFSFSPNELTTLDLKLDFNFNSEDKHILNIWTQSLSFIITNNGTRRLQVFYPERSNYNDYISIDVLYVTKGDWRITKDNANIQTN